MLHSERECGSIPECGGGREARVVSWECKQGPDDKGRACGLRKPWRLCLKKLRVPNYDDELWTDRKCDTIRVLFQEAGVDHTLETDSERQD